MLTSIKFQAYCCVILKDDYKMYTEDKWALWGIVLPNTKAYYTAVIIKKHDLGKIYT